mmetsp:Transcript_27154/g.74464  ORF Transcript_27154/g.74464 Transcript_27154/m.74464 type:complete len:575 (-) Transcript_27154:398-2122(-)
MPLAPKEKRETGPLEVSAEADCTGDNNVAGTMVASCDIPDNSNQTTINAVTFRCTPNEFDNMTSSSTIATPIGGITNNSGYLPNDNKTVSTTSTSTADGLSLSAEEESGSSGVGAEMQSTELDWSFLRQGQLFDREQQQKDLIEILDRSMGRGWSSNKNGKEFVLVSGLSGTGKTVLVQHTLKGPVTKMGGYFVYGKVDQRNKNSPQRPYAPFVAALDQFVYSLLQRQPSEAESVRTLARSTLTQGDVDLLLETFPSLQQIFRPKGDYCESATEDTAATATIPATTESITYRASFSNKNSRQRRRSRNMLKRHKSGNDVLGTTVKTPSSKMATAHSQKQLARVLRSFLETICDAQTRPMVLLIDDLQWSDSGTLVLLHSLLLSSSNARSEDNHSSSLNIEKSGGLLLVGTCRHNEVGVDHGLAQLLRTLEDDEYVTIRQIQVSKLSYAKCRVLVARVLGVPFEENDGARRIPESLAKSLDPLVTIAFEQTKGNAFFLLQFLRSLHDEGYLNVQPKGSASSTQTEAKPCSKEDSSSIATAIDDWSLPTNGPSDTSHKQPESELYCRISTLRIISG